MRLSYLLVPPLLARFDDEMRIEPIAPLLKCLAAAATTAFPRWVISAPRFHIGQSSFII